MITFPWTGRRSSLWRSTIQSSGDLSANPRFLRESTAPNIAVSAPPGGQFCSRVRTLSQDFVVRKLSSTLFTMRTNFVQGTENVSVPPNT